MQSVYNVFSPVEAQAFWSSYAVRTQKAAKRPEVAGNQAKTAGKRCILVVDDHDDTLRSMRLLLSRLGYEVLAAETIRRRGPA